MAACAADTDPREMETKLTAEQRKFPPIHEMNFMHDGTNRILTITGSAGSVAIELAQDDEPRKIVEKVSAISAQTNVYASVAENSTTTLNNLSLAGKISFELYGDNSEPTNIVADVLQHDLTPLMQAINQVLGDTRIVATISADLSSVILTLNVTHSLSGIIKIENFNHSAADATIQAQANVAEFIAADGNFSGETITLTANAGPTEENTLTIKSVIKLRSAEPFSIALSKGCRYHDASFTVVSEKDNQYSSAKTLMQADGLPTVHTLVAYVDVENTAAALALLEINADDTAVYPTVVDHPRPFGITTGFRADSPACRIATSRGNVTVLRQVLAIAADRDINHRFLPIHLFFMACRQGQIEIVRMLLATNSDGTPVYPSLIKSLDLDNEHYYELLMDVGKAGHSEILRILLTTTENGDFIFKGIRNSCIQHNNHNIHNDALFLGKFEIVRLFLATKPNGIPVYPSIFDYIVTHNQFWRAIASNNSEVVNLFLATHPNGTPIYPEIMHKIVTGTSYGLALALREGCIKTAKLLLSRQPDGRLNYPWAINNIAPNSILALHLACFTGNLATVQLLLARQEDGTLAYPETMANPAIDSRRLIYLACCGSNFRILQLLLSNNADGTPVYPAVINAIDSLNPSTKLFFGLSNAADYARLTVLIDHMPMNDILTNSCVLCFIYSKLTMPFLDENTATNAKEMLSIALNDRLTAEQVTEHMPEFAAEIISYGSTQARVAAVHTSLSAINTSLPAFLGEQAHEERATLPRDLQHIVMQHYSQKAADVFQQPALAPQYAAARAASAGERVLRKEWAIPAAAGASPAGTPIAATSGTAARPALDATRAAAASAAARP